MWWYVGKRLLQTIPVFLGATLIIYAVAVLPAGDPILNLFGNKPVSRSGARRQLAAQYHLDDPLLVQWLYFLKGAVTLDFGNTFSGQPVIDLIRQTFPVTVTLAVMALVFDAVIGVMMGTVRRPATQRRLRLLDAPAVPPADVDPHLRGRASSCS